MVITTQQKWICLVLGMMVTLVFGWDSYGRARERQGSTARCHTPEFHEQFTFTNLRLAQFVFSMVSNNNNIILSHACPKKNDVDPWGLPIHDPWLFWFNGRRKLNPAGTIATAMAPANDVPLPLQCLDCEWWVDDVQPARSNKNKARPCLMVVNGASKARRDSS